MKSGVFRAAPGFAGSAKYGILDKDKLTEYIQINYV